MFSFFPSNSSIPHRIFICKDILTYFLLAVPYDGNAIGAYKQDKMQLIKGWIAPATTEGGYWLVVSGDYGGAFAPRSLIGNSAVLSYTSVTTEKRSGIDFDSSRVARTGNETAPASLSAYPTITY